ncbi:Squamous cell carcinoma antigen recognized by T-cells 3 [Heracleum sosnowskyi]|uniref:Squamous cell carcinoma antigen recognized by T-cells 3 n=1 Tax=Heracleum sosnowskyi TaxID=360622 RepID=A0AAD8HR20_9APIA|nr:Squamous cell carcinoma antigen recognized by T-cells 3 [Heracleum sosnowskyi]
MAEEEEQSAIPMHTDDVMSDPKTGSDSDSDSDSDDEAVKLQIQTLESELYTNPANYDAHVQYISALRKEGELEKLRGAREAMSEVFPLTPAMWQEWIKDEISISSGSDAFTAVEKLYERGVLDYLSVSLWCDYINFVQEYDPFVREGSPTGISKLRNLFERALTAAGLHIAEGYKIWEAYRKFEQTLLDTMDKTDIESREKQVQHIRNIFHRQLSVPHTALNVTLIAYKSWEAEQGTGIDPNNSSLDGIAAHTSSAYQKALEMLNTRVHLEDLVSKQESTDLERLQEYMAYLKFEQTSGDPARVQILYERAIAEFPISADLWLNYTEYLDRTLKAAKIVKDVYCRATRNCPWVKELWVRYLLILERLHASEEDISAVFEKSLNCTFSSLDEYLDIFLTRVDGLRRRISIDGEPNVEFALIRDTFQRASDYLSEMNSTGSLLHMYRYWARLESSLGKDIVAARGVWESLLKSSGSIYEVWEGYISMEIGAGHINNARSLYKRCYSKRLSGTGSEDICHSWIRFEREYGTLQDLDHAVQKVSPRLAELQLFRLLQDSKYVAVSTDQTDTSSKVKEKKRKPVPGVNSEESPAKRQKGTSQNLNQKKSHNVDKNQLKTSDVVEEKEHSEGQVGKPERENDVETKASSVTKSRHYNDQCTAFMSNLNFKATGEDLRNFFSDVGGIKDVRILKDKFTGKSRGLAYIDFSDDEHLAAALKKNKRILLGKKVSIARSDPKQGRKEGSTKHGKSESKEPTQISEGNKGTHSDQGHREDKVQMIGKNTFAAPRNVRPLGYTSNINTDSDRVAEVADEQPKSNDEFRKMLLRK